LVAFGQVDKQPNALALLPDNPAVLFQLATIGWPSWFLPRTA
jgi:hypothetical protein